MVTHNTVQLKSSLCQLVVCRARRFNADATADRTM
jgi:hypothetical protein